MPILAIVLFLLAAQRTPVQAQTPGVITVCESGCAHTALQAALDAAEPGNRIVLTAGQRFVGNFKLPYKGPSGDPIVIESSRMSELPPSGFRVQPEHAALMPKLVAGDRSSPVLRTSEEEAYVQRVDPASDQIIFESPHLLRDGEAMAFFIEGPPPGGIEGERRYYVRLVSATVIKVAASKDGPVIDITAPFTGKHLRAATAEPAARYVLRGIEFTVPPNAVQEYDLVRIGSGQESSREGLPTQIEMDHVYIHGLPDQNGPRHCMLLNARQFKLTDSRLEHCNKEGEESKGITMIMAPGPILLQNNYIEGGAINLLMGGDYVRIQNLVNGDEGGIEIYGNHFYKPLRLKYSAGPGGASAPAGRCNEGNRYLNTSTGQWYICNPSNSWDVGPACACGEYYRRTDVAQSCAAGACWECSAEAVFAPARVLRSSSYSVKNLFEIKSGINVYVHGNVFENNWVNSDQSGVAVWVISQVSQRNADGWVRGENITFVNNIVRNSQQGIRISSEGNTRFGTPNRNVVVKNNLLYDIGATATPSLAVTDARPISLAGECVNCQFVNNTVVSGVRGGTAISIDTNPMTGFRLANNIGNFNAYGLHADRGLPLSYYLPDGVVTNNVLVAERPETSRFATGSNRVIPTSTVLFTDTARKNFRLNPDSPFSASCTQNCEYAGDDGQDLGANIDLVEEETSGAVSGTPNWRDELGVSVTAVEPQKVSLVYYVRDETTCLLNAAAAASPRTTIPDVDPAAGDNRDRDDRPGNLIEGAQRTFVVGTVDPLRPATKYNFRLTCGAKRVSGTFQTAPAP